MDDGRKASAALRIIEKHGGADGSHHKAWVIDQVARILVGENDYDEWVAMMRDGEDGPNTYDWDCGVAP